MIENTEPLTVPFYILALENVNANEKMLLALYSANPKAKNVCVLATLGVGLAGLKKIKLRLITKGYLRSGASGYEVTVPGMETDLEGNTGQFVRNSNDAKTSNKVATFPEIKSLDDIMREYFAAIEGLTDPCTILRLTERTMNEVQSNWPVGPPRDAVLNDLTIRRDAFFALNYVLKNCPRDQLAQLDFRIATATREQLAKLRVGIERAQLSGVKPQLLLDALEGKLL